MKFLWKPLNVKGKNVDDFGKITYKTIEKEIVFQKERSHHSKKLMANSQLFQSEFDLNYY